MTRETRLVVTLFAVGVGGIAALSFVARQYREHVTPVAAIPGEVTSVAAPEGALRPDMAPAGNGSEDAAARAARLADGFLAARAAAQSVCARYGARAKEIAAAVTGNFPEVRGKPMGAGLDVISDYRVERMAAFAAHGMTYADYVVARSAWRSWRASAPDGNAALAAAFAARRAAAEQAGLGEFESLDDAIK